eukprot:1042376-Rhodomonas_salina.1
MKICEHARENACEREALRERAVCGWGDDEVNCGAPDKTEHQTPEHQRTSAEHMGGASGQVADFENSLDVGPHAHTCFSTHGAGRVHTPSECRRLDRRSSSPQNLRKELISNALKPGFHISNLDNCNAIPNPAPSASCGPKECIFNPGLPLASIGVLLLRTRTNEFYLSEDQPLAVRHFICSLKLLVPFLQQHAVSEERPRPTHIPFHGWEFTFSSSNSLRYSSLDSPSGFRPSSVLARFRPTNSSPSAAGSYCSVIFPRRCTQSHGLALHAVESRYFAEISVEPPNRTRPSSRRQPTVTGPRRSNDGAMTTQSWRENEAQP